MILPHPQANPFRGLDGLLGKPTSVKVLNQDPFYLSKVSRTGCVAEGLHNLTNGDPFQNMFSYEGIAMQV